MHADLRYKKDFFRERVELTVSRQRWSKALPVQDSGKAGVRLTANIPTTWIPASELDYLLH